MTRGSASDGASTASRAVLLAYSLGPVALLFIVPLFFYRMPMAVGLGAVLVHVGPSVVAKALAVCAVWFGLAAGIVLWPFRGEVVPLQRSWPRPAVWHAFLACSLLGAVVSLVHSLVRMPVGLEDTVHQLAFAPIVGVALGVYVLRDGAGRTNATVQRLLVWGLMTVDVAVALGVPVLLSKVGPAAFGAIGVLYGLTAMRVPGRRILTVVLVVIPILVAALPLKDVLRAEFYRHDAYHRVLAGQAATSSASSSSGHVLTQEEELQQFDPWLMGLRFHRAVGPLLAAQYALARAVNRINRLGDLAYVVETTPGTVSFSGYTTYRPIIGLLVPSALWKNKPQENSGQFYGHRYGFLDPNDLTHAVNLPMVTEGWMAAGWAGVLLSAAAFGVLLRLIWRYWIGGHSDPGNVVIGMAVVGAAVAGESNLTLVLGGIVHALLVYWVIDIAVRAWGRRMLAYSSGGY